LEVDHELAREPPFNKTQLMSIGEYLSSLEIQSSNDVNVHQLFVTALQDLGLWYLSPFVSLLPVEWQKKGDGVLSTVLPQSR
jgi:hypothetical protein